MHENRVVLVAGLIPVYSAILKNSRRAKQVSKAIDIVKYHPPNKTTTKPNIPIIKPLLNLILIIRYLKLLYKNLTDLCYINFDFLSNQSYLDLSFHQEQLRVYLEDKGK